MEYPQIDLYEFLTESELQHYYTAIKNELKITNAAQFKYATDEDLKSIGLSRPEIRRLRKFYEKYFPHGYLSKIKRLLQAPASAIVKRDDANNTLSNASTGSCAELPAATKSTSSPSKVPNNKHIIPADSIAVNKQLGTGEFGIVQQGVWTNGSERIQVAIKCLCRERMQSNPMEFLKEAAIMHSIEHENIVRLYGVVLAPESLMLVTELAHLRSLLECLKDPGLRISFLTIPTLCEFAIQICNGMSYLENKRLIHRDLAARNILVFSKNKVKISDFGLSRALGVGKDYYKTNFNVNLKLPIAWCAPECINYLRFTNSSDVWAYGVCLWEMFSYGFQPWAALTGLQILEGIDAPNYQRLEQPDCCPREYYTLMMKCWQDDPLKRPKFSEIYELLPDLKPEQLKAVVNCIEAKNDHLLYRQGDIITVLDRNTGTPFWKGVLITGKTGYFNPSNTVAYLEGLPSSNRDSFCRISEQRSSKRKLRTEMISKPQNDFKHTGHVGIDGDSFGDVAFLGNSQNYNHVPRQIVTPYKPSEDIEQTPLLLPPTPTSPDSLQTASGYFPEGSNNATLMNPSFVSSTENTPKHFQNVGQSSFEFPGQHINLASTNPFSHKTDSAFAMQNNNYGIENKTLSLINAEQQRTAGDATWKSTSRNSTDEQHEYHEISDDEITADKLDFGPSLLDEINSMFGSMSTAINQPKSPDLEQANVRNEFTEMTSKLVAKAADTNGNKFGTSSKKKAAGTVKPISVKDEKMLNQAIEIANEISARSMIDLVSDQPYSAQSPKRKFSFRFPHLTNNGVSEKSNTNASSAAGAVNSTNASGHLKCSSPYSKKKNFTEELQSIPDLQTLIGEEGREAYNSLIERKTALGVGVGVVGLSPAANLLRHLDTNEFEMATAKTLPRRSLCLRNENNNSTFATQDQQPQLQRSASCNKAEHEDQHTIASIPLQQAPRPMTLPTRGAAYRARNRADISTAALSKASQSFDTHELHTSGNNDAADIVGCTANNTSPCESPSYMANTFYKFPEKSPTTTMAPQNISGDANPIPLPPREGKKHIKTNPKRHVRKYPLIIPANGLQRTLNKVTEITPTEDHDANTLTCSTTAAGKFQNGSSVPNHLERITLEIVAAIRPNAMKSATVHDKKKDIVCPTYQNIEKHATATASAAGSSEAADDTASLQFESIMEADFNKGNVLQSPDVTDGFYNFSIQKDNYNKSKAAADFEAQKISGLYVNEDELRNLDIERNLKSSASSTGSKSSIVMPTNIGDKPEIADTAIATAAVTLNTALTPTDDTIVELRTDAAATAVTKEKSKSVTGTAGSANNELAGNALFKKVRQSVEMAMGGGNDVSTKTLPRSQSTTQARRQTEAEYFAAATARLADSNSVSCEDLLEFSDQKPKGCERGVDSDEVRIMVKVLGKDSTPTRCLDVLEFIDWDVHKAIKIIKLQNILSTAELSISESVKFLQKYEWDLHITAMKLKGLKT